MYNTSSWIKFNLPCLAALFLYGGFNSIEYYYCLREQCDFSNDTETGANQCKNLIPWNFI